MKTRLIRVWMFTGDGLNKLKKIHFEILHLHIHILYLL